MKKIEVVTKKIKLKTKGNIDIINITDDLQKIVEQEKVIDGILTVFVPGATGSVATIEYEDELIKDTKEFFLELVREDKIYKHNRTHFNGNATSHLRATLLGSSLVIPITENRLQLGVWQHVVFIDFDNRERNREIIVKIIGLKDN
jgi:secondary thiamine-phosphate synthase enzyme